MKEKINNLRVAVVGLGYVGLPVAIAFGKKYSGTIGFDVKKERISSLQRGKDNNLDVPDEELEAASIFFTSDSQELKAANFIIIAVPTPTDVNNCPDFGALEAASKTVGESMGRRVTVVYESTVYPGATEEICIPVLEKYSGLKCGQDFSVGYSPERINPGDREHTFEKIIKVVSGDSKASTELIAAAYGSVVKAGVHLAPSIKVAEAAKVIENTQRDLNIALMNELSIIFERLGIRTLDVLEAAATKWNFLKFSPGLVGGHCIGVDPFYLTTKAKQLGYQPEVVLAGRRINDQMSVFVAQKLIKLLIAREVNIKGAKVGILGLTFKADITDIRNSKVFDVIKELKSFGIVCVCHDPYADPLLVKEEYGVEVGTLTDFTKLNALVFAVPHKEYLGEVLTSIIKEQEDLKVVVDLHGKMDRTKLGCEYWSL